MLVNILIIFFLFLIIYQFLAPSFKEGLETAPGPYMEYPDDPMILGKQNAGNIEVLRTEVQNVTTLEPRVLQLETDVKNLNEQLAGIQQQNSEAVSSFGNSTGELSGSKEEGQDDEIVPGEGVVDGEDETSGESSSSSWGGFGGSSEEKESFRNKYVLKHYF